MELLKWLFTFGPKLQEILPDLQVIFEAVQRIFGKLNLGEPEGGLAVVELTADEQAELDKVVALLQPDGAQAALDLGFIFKAMAFFKQHPELLTLLMGLFAKKG